MVAQTEAEQADIAREVTDEELQHYWEHGWVKMERLISPETAARMLAVAKSEILEKEVDNEHSHERGVWRDRYMLGRDDLVEPFASLNRSPVIGRNVQRFMRRNVPVGFHADVLAVKMPSGSESSRLTGWHQDYPNFPLDRKGLLSFWIALDDLTPEQGVMRFFSGSHKEGPLGKRHFETDERGLLDHCPYIEQEYEMSPPMHLKAGDCTVHSSLVIHGAPANATDKPRWSYIMSYYPGDACYTGGEHFLFNKENGMVFGQPALSPKFPIIYEAQ